MGLQHLAPETSYEEGLGAMHSRDQQNMHHTPVSVLRTAERERTKKEMEEETEEDWEDRTEEEGMEGAES